MALVSALTWPKSAFPAQFTPLNRAHAPGELTIVKQTPVKRTEYHGYQAFSPLLTKSDYVTSTTWTRKTDVASYKYHKSNNLNGVGKMTCEYNVSRDYKNKTSITKNSEAAHLARFMLWAYDEASENLKDEFLRSAIKAILYYMGKKYKINTDEYGGRLVSEPS